MSSLGAIRRLRDRAGGVLITGSPNVFVNLANSVRLFDLVQPHGKPPHSPTPRMIEGSPNVFVNLRPMCREEDIASCGHPAMPGSSNVFVNSFQPTSLGISNGDTVTDQSGNEIVRETNKKLPGEK